MEWQITLLACAKIENRVSAHKIFFMDTIPCSVGFIMPKTLLKIKF